MKEKVLDFLGEKLPKELEVEKIIEVPKINSHGDFSLPMFQLSKILKKSPIQIAEEYAREISKNLPKYIQEIRAEGPYLNIFLNKSIQGIQILKTIETGEFSKKGNLKKNILIEFPSPNTNKPLHLGHVRNMILGKSLGNLLERAGANVIRVNLNNDRGIAICKSMLAYDKFGNEETPETTKIKPDYFVGKYYVKFEREKNNELEAQAYEMLRKWESEDKETLELWDRMRQWSLQGFSQTYSRYGISHDKEYFESDIYEKGRDIVLEGLKKGIFEKDEEGNIIADLEEKNLGKKVLLRADGTSIYITQDIALAYEKIKDFKFDSSIFIVGSEQIYHFKVLFELFSMLNLSSLENNYHLAYGMVYLPDGRMKSREGNVVEADTLIDDLSDMAANEIKKRNHELEESEIKRRAESIALGAITFFILKVNPLLDMTFDPKESLSFEGETGPYVQYTYARMRSLIKRGGIVNIDEINFENSDERELALLKILNEYQETIYESAEKYKPHLLLHYMLRLSQKFNEIYQNLPVLKAEKDEKNRRLLLAHAGSKILADALTLLGIEVLEEM